MKKRIALMLLALLVAISLAACNSSSPASSDSPSVTPPASPSTGPSASSPVDNFIPPETDLDIVGILITGKKPGVPWLEDFTIHLDEGQSVYFMLDALGAKNYFNLDNVISCYELSVMGAGRTWLFDRENGFSDRQGGATYGHEEGEGFHYVYSYAVVDFDSGKILEDDELEAYYSTVTYNLTDEMEYSPTGTRKFDELNLKSDGSWQPSDPALQNWGGILGYWNMVHPDIWYNERGECLSLRVGLQIIAPEAGDYIINMAPYTPFGVDLSTASMVLLTNGIVQDEIEWISSHYRVEAAPKSLPTPEADLVAIVKTDKEASEVPVIENMAIQLDKGQSIYFMVDVLGSDNVFSANDVLTYLNLTLTCGDNIWKYDRFNALFDRQGGKDGFAEGEGFYYVWSWAEVEYLTSDVITDTDAYYATVLDNLAELTYAPDGPGGYAEIGMGGPKSWTPTNGPFTPNWAGVLGAERMISPTISDTAASIAEGKSFTVRIGLQLIAPETGEYILDLSPFTPYGEGLASVLVLVEK